MIEVHHFLKVVYTYKCWDRFFVRKGFTFHNKTGASFRDWRFILTARAKPQFSAKRALRWFFQLSAGKDTTESALRLPKRLEIARPYVSWKMVTSRSPLQSDQIQFIFRSAPCIYVQPRMCVITPFGRTNVPLNIDCWNFHLDACCKKIARRGAYEHYLPRFIWFLQTYPVAIMVLFARNRCKVPSSMHRAMIPLHSPFSISRSRAKYSTKYWQSYFND